MIDYKVKRSENCILIDVDKWLQNTSNLVQRYRMNGKAPVNYITEVIKKNLITKPIKDDIKEGDIVLLSKIISEMSQYSKFEIEGKHYFNVPYMQVLGVFKDKEISCNSLSMLNDKLLLERVDIKTSILEIPENEHTSVYKVLKTGNIRYGNNWEETPLIVKQGDNILIRDNIVTSIVLNGKVYYVAEECNVVAIFNNDFSLENASIINGSILLKHYVSKNVLNSILLTPDLKYEDEDFTDIYNRDLFQVSYVDPKVSKLKKDDIVVVNDNVTFYAYYNNEKYNMLNGTSYIECIIER